MYAVMLIEKIPHTSCETAQAITVPFTTFAYNYNAETTTATCGRTAVAGAGVWYTFTTDVDARVTLSTCHPSTTIDTVIAVWRGSCARLTCLTAETSTDGCFGQTQLDFDAAPANTYYVFVGSATAKTGNFRFTATTDAYTPHSYCGERIPLELEAGFRRWSFDTHNAFPTQVKRNGTFVYVNGFFYTLPAGARGALTLMTCAATTEVPTMIAQMDSCGTMLGATVSTFGTVTRSADYTAAKCSENGAFLSFTLRGTEPESVVFVGGYFPETLGFIDFEVYFTPEEDPSSGAASSSSSVPPPAHSSSTHPATSSSAAAVDGGLSSGMIALIVILVLFAVLVVVGLIVVVAILVLRKLRAPRYAQID